ncbi:hypothetical protein [Bacillus phage vB_BanS-Thrax3]|nr:hypothetical protein [Bacillus phage vB_BanS-Thrax3]
MYKHISKNSVRKHKEILEGKTVECFNSGNGYKGGEFETLEGVQLNTTLEDVREGYAVLALNKETGKYLLRYAGRCKKIVQ